MAITIADLQKRLEHIACSDPPPPPPGTEISLHGFKHEVLSAFYRLLEKVPNQDRNVIAEILRKQFETIGRP